MTRAACALAVVIASGCWGSARRSAPPAPPKPAHPAFAPPSTIADCPDTRLAVTELPFELPPHARAISDEPLETFLPHHAHKVGDILIFLVPTLDLRAHVLSLEARRFDTRSDTWLPAVSFTLAQHAGLAPPFQSISTAVVQRDVLVAWDDLTRRRIVKRFTVATGAWDDADPGARLPAPNYLLIHAAYPPDPEPTTGVTLDVQPVPQTATFSRDHERFGTLTFPSRPGAYIGAFANTRTALLWNHRSAPEERDVPAAERLGSYLVHLETGAACRITRDLAYPEAAVFRVKHAIVMLNVYRTAPERTSCPPGAPCKPPERSRLDHVSLTVLRDR